MHILCVVISADFCNLLNLENAQWSMGIIAVKENVAYDWIGSTEGKKSSLTEQSYENLLQKNRFTDRDEGRRTIL